MSVSNRVRFLQKAASSLRNVRARTWLILGAGGLVFLGLLVWAAIAVLSWVWGQAATVSDTGKRLASVAVTQVEQVVPGLKEQLGGWLPALGEEPLGSDVSGTDIGPIPRYPGLVRTHFAREGQLVEAHYAGRMAFDAVLAHYVQGFAAAGYTQQVISATSEGEHHRYLRGQESIDFWLLRGTGGKLDVRLKGSQ